MPEQDDFHHLNLDQQIRQQIAILDAWTHRRIRGMHGASTESIDRRPPTIPYKVAGNSVPAEC